MKIFILSVIIVGLLCAIFITYTTLADGVELTSSSSDGNVTNIISDFDKIYETALKSPFKSVSQEIGNDTVCRFYRHLINEIGLAE